MDRASFGLGRWLLPSLTQWLWLLILLMLLTPTWRRAMVSADGDACMHWRVGESMLASRSIVRADEFSYTRPGAPVVTKEWLAQVLFALAGRVAGLEGLVVLAALVIATTVALVHAQLLREGHDPLLATGLALLVVWASRIHWLARPHVFTFLLLFLWNDVLRRHARDGQRGWGMTLGLAALTVGWVNLHGGYLAGCLTLGAYWLGALVERNGRRLRQLTVAGLVCGLVSLLNPNGYELHLHNLQFLRSDFFTDRLNEYRSLNFHLAGVRGFLVWLGVVLFALATARTAWRATSLILLVIWGYAALYAARNVPLFVLMSAPLVAPALSASLHQRWADLGSRLAEVHARSHGWPVAAGLALAALLWLPPTQLLAEKAWPVAAIAHVRQHSAEFTGRVFNEYAWGGYLLQYLPEHKVFVDGRADFYGEAVARDYERVRDLQPGWQQVLERHQVEWVLMPKDSRLGVALNLSRTWDVVYSDAVTVIHHRRQTDDQP